MNAAERLHPAVQHHVVNSLGWRSLRPHQERAIGPILDGANVLVQAPTAGGKTEAAALPLLSRMLSEEWAPLSVLYLCPIKALLNDLEVRLSRLAGLVGRRVGLWHGDVGPAARRRIATDPPDVLLTTPESLEVMLVSRGVDHAALFSTLRAVVVDEIHAFAGDDRGWHLLAVVERIQRLARAPVQRVALSATLANPEEILAWLSAGSVAPRAVVTGAPTPPADADVTVDAVGSLANAALVVSRLHRGEKRLVFTDSRSRAEELARELRSRGVETYVSHSSLGVDERRRAESAFAAGRDCVIVATSTLELGIDVGDLDRVIQVDAPSAVASFLQRLGRSGRRAGTRRNCLFLATEDEALLRALAIVRLWTLGWVEPVLPPPAPWHVVAQQVLASVLEAGTRGVDVGALHSGLAAFLGAAGVTREAIRELVGHLVATGVLACDGDVLAMGPEGERRYGAKHFLEIFSVFQSAPLISVLHGIAEVGQVHESTFHRESDGPTYLTLAGRSWRVTHMDWRRRLAYVEPADEAGRSRWLGEGPALSYEMAQSIEGVLREGVPERFLSIRARAAVRRLGDAFDWLRSEVTTVVVDAASGSARWWTFAGDRYNRAAGDVLRGQARGVAVDALGVTFSATKSAASCAELLADVQSAVVATAAAVEPPGLEDRIKFLELLPPRARAALVSARYGVGGVAEFVCRRQMVVRLIGRGDSAHWGDAEVPVERAPL